MKTLPPLAELQWKTSNGNSYTQYGFLLTDDSETIEIASTRGSTDFTDSADIDTNAASTKNMFAIGETLYERRVKDNLA